MKDSFGTEVVVRKSIVTIAKGQIVLGKGFLFFICNSQRLDGESQIRGLERIFDTKMREIF